MTTWHYFLLISLGLLIPTAYAAKIGAPWAPTRKKAIKSAFDRIDISKDDVVIDLGAGDGKTLLIAAEHGAKAIGYELSPIMWLVAKLRTIGKKGIRVRLNNFYKQTLPKETTAIFAFLVPDTMPRLKKYLATQSLPNLEYVVIYAFPFQDVQALTIVRENNCAPVYIYHARQIIEGEDQAS